MTDEKFKRGDIVLNRWSGVNQKFIIMSIHGKQVKGIFTDGIHVKFDNYVSFNDIYEPFHDGTPSFVKVGRSKIFDIIREELSND